MIGSLLAGTDESPGETILYQGRTFKSYRGMGSLGAMSQGNADRYAQDPNSKLVPEGIEGRVPYKGRWRIWCINSSADCKSGMGYTGCGDDPRAPAEARDSCASRRPACARATSTT